MSSVPGRRVDEASDEAATEPARPPTEGDAPGRDTDGGTERDTAAVVRDALAALTARLDREHERAAHREAVIDRLHEENERLRRGELQSALEPLRTALYRLHDQARREARRWAEPDPPDAAHAAALLAAVADEIADALARSGVERYTVEPGEPFDAVRHRPVAVEPVADPARAGTVLWARSDGFEQGGRVVRKAEVCVAKAAGTAFGQAPAPAAAEAAQAADAAEAAEAAEAAAPEADAAADPASGQSHPREAGRSETMSSTSTASSTPASGGRVRRASASGVSGPGSDR